MEHEDPKEVFKTFSQVLEALLNTYHNRYPSHPAQAMTMVLIDFGAWVTEFNKEYSGQEVQMIPFLEKMGEDLAVRIGGHSVYEQARTALITGGES